MNEQSLQIADVILNKFNDLRQQSIGVEATGSQAIPGVYDVIEQYAHLRHQAAATITSINAELITDYQNLKSNYQEDNRLHSTSFNFLKMFSIGETMHSYLLAKLLDPNSEHGQGKLLLNLFLEMLGIERPQQGHWTVTAEKGRIDVLIKRKHPHSVIVIENKSNYAPDQQHQLYRYWYQEIYYPNLLLNRSINYGKEHGEHYQLIYLSPDENKIPLEHSLLKPSGWSEQLPDWVPLEPKLWLFNREIITWLQQVLNHLPSGNHRFREYVKQYIEYWS